MSIDLINDMNTKVAMLDKALGQLGSRGREHAQKEQDYRIALAEKILIERDKGMPVTIISDVCRGDRTIARLKFERDVAEVVYKSALEAINVLKLQVKVLDEQIGREWHRA
jgi:hypothetical protein